MRSSGGNRHLFGYTLVELLVVIGVITLIGLVSLPNVFNQTDRADLENSAQRIKQMLVEARTRSIAPRVDDSLSRAYQVVFGEFDTFANAPLVEGDIYSNRVMLQRHNGRCDSVDRTTGFTLRELKLPRSVYISQFFPYAKTSVDADPDKYAAIMFTIGRVGFQCGSLETVAYDSVDFGQSTPGWTENAECTGKHTRFAYIELSARKLAEKRYITVDRLTNEVSIGRSKPSPCFTPKAYQPNLKSEASV